VHIKKLVKQPLTKFSKLSGKDGILESHARTDYHKLAFQQCKDILNAYKNPSLDIKYNDRNIMKNNSKQQILDNREGSRTIDRHPFDRQPKYRQFHF